MALFQFLNFVRNEQSSMLFLSLKKKTKLYFFRTQGLLQKIIFLDPKNMLTEIALLRSSFNKRPRAGGSV